jgi:putative SOS response-associated peptidase YedK
MCGRYVSPSAAAIEREFRRIPADWHFGASFNVAPSQRVPAIRRAAAGEAGPEGVLLRWGLVPFFAHGRIGAYSTINARVESVTSSASYRTPWKRGQRCLIPALGFYEWHVNADGTKQPYYIHLNDRELFAFAGLWDRSVAEDGSVLESCTILTLPANELMASVHNGRARMPAILNAAAHEAWLGAEPDVALSLIRPYPQELMVAFPVARRVNTPRNNDAGLIEPFP